MINNLVVKTLPKSVIRSLHRYRFARIKKIRVGEGSWTASSLRYRSPYSTYPGVFTAIEKIALKTSERAYQPLWEGYSEIEDYPLSVGNAAKRTSCQVSVDKRIGEFFTWLVLQRRPSLVVEFGTAFGVSGMYWLAGLQINGRGHLYTFEPNETWANIALQNLSCIGDRFTLTNGTFEDNFSLIKNEIRNIDIAFIDAIHTREHVVSQLELVLKKSAPGTLIAFDDIRFSEEMSRCWQEIASDERYVAAFEFERLGIVELK